MGYIYLITNILNNTKYIGQTKCNDIETRWSSHKKMNKYSIGSYLLAAYNKYGISNFKFQIICICFDEDCDKYEEYYIKYYNTLVPNGYNLKSGGKVSKHSEITKKLISEKLKKRITENIRNEYREKTKYDKNFSYLKKYTDSEKKELSIKQINYWKNLTDEQKEKISLKRKEITQKSDNIKSNLELGRKSRMKQVGKFDNNNELICIYNSITEASKFNNISYTSISKVCLCKPKYNTAGGYIWKFI